MTAKKTNPIIDHLTELGVDAKIAAKIIEELGATSVEDLALLTESDLTAEGIGMKTLQARALVQKLNPAPVAPSTSEASVDPTKELGDDEAPSSAHMAGFAGAMGMDPMTMMMFMQGQDVDVAGMFPIAMVVDGYNPKLRNMFLMVMGQFEQRLGVPIVVIDSNGSINKRLTVEYIEGLEEGRDPAENDLYFDEDSTPHEIIRVGVDAQSIYDADPLDPTKALQKSGMGIGRVNWSKTSLEVKQVAYYAATKTNELDPKNDGHMSWLRDHMKDGANRLTFHGQAPRAIAMYNEAARTGSLPTLRTMLSRNARRKEIMPRRRRTSPRDLTGVGMDRDNL